MIDDAVVVVESVAGRCSWPRTQKKASSQAQKTSEASLLLRQRHYYCLLHSHEVVPFSSSSSLRLANDAGVRNMRKEGRMDDEGRRLAPDVGGDGSCSSRVTCSRSRSDDGARRCCEKILVGVTVEAAAVAASQRYCGDGGNRHARHDCCTAHTQQTSSLGLP